MSDSQFTEVAAWIAGQDENFLKKNLISNSAYIEALRHYADFMRVNTEMTLTSDCAKCFAAGYSSRLREEIERGEK